MMNQDQCKLTLDRPTAYQIKVPGHLEEDGLNWFGEIGVENHFNKSGYPITTLTGSLDQAALIGLLRHLYSLGLPLISVICLEFQ